MNVTPALFYSLTEFVVLLIGFSKGGFGGTLGVLATPLMTLILPANEVIGLLLPLLILADVFAVTSYWREWDWSLIVGLAPGAIVGVTVGTYFITNAPTRALTITLAIIILLFVLYKIFEALIFRSMTYQARNWHGLVAGLLSGLFSSLSHSGGPPVSIYLILRRIPTRTFNATTALFFAILNWIKVPYYFYAHLFDFKRLWSLIWLLPLLPLGVWVGRHFANRISREVFERTIVILLVVTALLLIFE